MTQNKKPVQPLPKDIVDDFTLEEYIEWTEGEEEEFMRILQDQTKKDEKNEDS